MFNALLAIWDRVTAAKKRHEDKRRDFYNTIIAPYFKKAEELHNNRRKRLYAYDSALTAGNEETVACIAHEMLRDMVYSELDRELLRLGVHLRLKYPELWSLTAAVDDYIAPSTSSVTTVDATLEEVRAWSPAESHSNLAFAMVDIAKANPSLEEALTAIRKCVHFANQSFCHIRDAHEELKDIYLVDPSHSVINSQHRT